MSTDGWEQRLADLGQARELREEIARTIATASFKLVPDPEGGHYGTSAEPEEIADALLSGPLAPLLATVERVEALAERFGWDTMPVPDWTGRQVHQAIRRALDGPT